MAIVAILLSAAGVFFAKRSSDSSKRSANAAEQSVIGAAKSRSDYLGPEIHIEPPRALRARWILSPYVASLALAGPPAEVKPGHSLAYPGDAEQRILLGVFVNFRNEGHRTASVTIACQRSEFCGDFDEYEEVTSPKLDEARTIDSFDPLIKDNTFTIGPGESQGVIVRDGTSLRQWIDQGGDQEVNVDIVAFTSPDGARQKWRLILQAPILQRNRFSDSVYTVGAWVLPEVSLSELPREYPENG